MPAIDTSTLTLVVIIALLAVALIAVSTGIAFNARAQRLPAATKYEDIHERVGLLQRTYSEKQAELREVEQKISERDRYAAEAAYLKEQVDEMRRALEQLAPARQEIEQVKEEAAQAAAKKKEVQQELDLAKAELEKVQHDLDPERLQRLRADAEAARAELDRLSTSIEPMRAERDAALRTIAEAQAIEARVAGLEARRAELSAEAEELRARLAGLRSEIDIAREEREVARGGAAKAIAERDTASIELEMIRAKADELRAKVSALEAMRDQIEKGLNNLAGGTVALTGTLTPEARADILKDLIQFPESLKSPPTLRLAQRLETDALHDVRRYLEQSGLTFSDRTLRAFHTALKINDTAQLTMLAGVSGTGKSLLPRRYAEAMGIHFLQVAVEPRWDSPQDLLGFYNYVEKKYRATELSRLMVHLAPMQNLDLPEGAGDRRDHMAIVLLDEMNLARVEYYFSEFLSRLEARPPWQNDFLLEKARDALIPVDIRGLDDPPMLFPAHNLLFVGTMNDDESTQSLSDKVLDRGNVLQFPAPPDFPISVQGQGTPSPDAQSFRAWRAWVKSPRRLDGAVEAVVKETISSLAQTMQNFAKPFGHRLNQSIRAYVANYPTEGNAGSDGLVPLVDQIELRILPKLRGVEINNHRDAFDRLDVLIREKLRDTQLADRVKATAEEQANASGLFVWRGMSRGV